MSLDIDLTCTDCDGEGLVEYMSLADNADVEEVPCMVCEGAGRRPPTLDEWDKLKTERDKWKREAIRIARQVQDCWAERDRLREFAERHGPHTCPDHVCVTCVALETTNV